jgi:hypothetical protein
VCASGPDIGSWRVLGVGDIMLSPPVRFATACRNRNKSGTGTVGSWEHPHGPLGAGLQPPTRCMMPHGKQRPSCNRGLRLCTDANPLQVVVSRDADGGVGGDGGVGETTTKSLMKKLYHKNVELEKENRLLRVQLGGVAGTYNLGFLST